MTANIKRERTSKKRPQKRTPNTTDLEKKINVCKNDLEELRGIKCFTLLLSGAASIGHKLVDSAFDDLSANYKNCENLDVIIDSGGGDIDAAYNLSMLLRRFSNGKLTFIVPRWAKSAATLLVCAGDEILMTPVAELGPLDPQITALNPFEERMEHFSPLHIESTLQLIRDEFENGNEKLAHGLMERLQFPLTLGSFQKSLEIGKSYVQKLLSTRMLHDNDQEKIKNIAVQLTTGYADHSYCLRVEEVSEIGLKANELSDEELAIVWRLHKLCYERQKLKQQEKQKEMAEQIKDLPSDILKMIPTELLTSPNETIKN